VLPADPRAGEPLKSFRASGWPAHPPGWGEILLAADWLLDENAPKSRAGACPRGGFRHERCFAALRANYGPESSACCATEEGANEPAPLARRTVPGD